MSKTSQFKTACKDDSGYITQLKQQKLDGKYSERVQIPVKAKFWGFCRQHLATLASPTIRLLL